MKGKAVTEIMCADCGIRANRTGTVQKYCAECSEKRDLARKSKWAREHPRSDERRKAATEQKRIAQRARRSESVSRSVATQLGPTWISESEQLDANLHWCVRLTFPFDYGMSKNAIWRTNGKGHIHLRKESNEIRQAMALAFSQHKSQVVQAKLWIDILVQKPNHRGDAVNVVDMVCDAIKDGIGLDDRWFSIRRLDWQIVKANPNIIVGIAQSATRDQRVCSYCGLILDLQPHFPKRAHGALGYGRVCKVCERSTEKIRSRQRLSKEVLGR